MLERIEDEHGGHGEQAEHSQDTHALINLIGEYTLTACLPSSRGQK